MILFTKSQIERRKTIKQAKATIHARNQVETALCVFLETWQTFSQKLKEDCQTFNILKPSKERMLKEAIDTIDYKIVNSFTDIKNYTDTAFSIRGNVNNIIQEHKALG